MLARFTTTCVLVIALGSRVADGQMSAGRVSIALDSTARLQLVNGQAKWVEHDGRPSLHLVPLEGHEHDTDQQLFAVLTDTDFGDGAIDVDVSGARRDGYPADNASAHKGHVGISFRVRGDTAERFYVRPENAILDDQVFRNRSIQYESDPAFPFQRLRQDSPGAYEAYAPMQPGTWTHLRIEVSGATAKLYVNGATQPSLVVTDLKNGSGHGKIALWSRISTDAYFSNLRIEKRPAAQRIIPPDSARFSEVVNGRAAMVDYRGRRAVHLIPSPASERRDANMLAILSGVTFKDGTIELDVAGAPRPGMPPDARGFVGLSFRTGEHADWSEVFYLRPTNGRADDQLRRNHSTQYVSEPDYPWFRLRDEHPGQYESYVDLETGAWTKLRIVVAGKTAQLFVNGAPQPVLVVNDLKRGDGAGGVALWAHVQTDAYFGAVTITPK